jgi:hypothetical protein
MKPQDWSAAVFIVIGFLLVALMLWARYTTVTVTNVPKITIDRPAGFL